MDRRGYSASLRRLRDAQTHPVFRQGQGVLPPSASYLHRLGEIWGEFARRVGAVNLQSILYGPLAKQLGLAASTLRFTTVVVTLSGDLFAGRQSWPMPGTLGQTLRLGRHRAVHRQEGQEALHVRHPQMLRRHLAAQGQKSGGTSRHTPAPRGSSTASPGWSGPGSSAAGRTRPRGRTLDRSHGRPRGAGTARSSGGRAPACARPPSTNPSRLLFQRDNNPDPRTAVARRRQFGETANRLVWHGPTPAKGSL